MAGGEPIRVLVCDDHDLFRKGLRMVLEAEEDIVVVAEAADGEQAVARVEELAPDVVLMDVRMPRMGGIDATRVIRQLFPTTRIIVLTVCDEEDDLYGAVKAGANGYLLKEVSIEEVADAVRAVYGGQSLISPSLASKLLNEFEGQIGTIKEAVLGAGPRLSEREVEILKMIALGMGNHDVAERMGGVGEHGAQPRGQHPGQAPAPGPDRDRDLMRAARHLSHLRPRGTYTEWFWPPRRPPARRLPQLRARPHPRARPRPRAPPGTGPTSSAWRAATAATWACRPGATSTRRHLDRIAIFSIWDALGAEGEHAPGRSAARAPATAAASPTRGSRAGPTACGCGPTSPAGGRPPSPTWRPASPASSAASGCPSRSPASASGR